MNERETEPALAQTHEATVNLTGERGLEIVFPATPDATCEIDFQAKLDPSDGVSNGTGVLVLWDLGDEFTGWTRFTSLALASAHAGEHRTHIANPVTEGNGTWTPSFPPEVNLSEGLRATVLAHHWDRTDETPSFWLQADCDEPIAPPEPAIVIDKIHYVTERTATGGAGGSAAVSPTPSANLLDRGSISLAGGPVEVRADAVCLGSGQGVLEVTGPETQEEWPLGNNAEGPWYRLLGPAGDWSYQVTHVEQSTCGWWAALWEAPTPR